MKLEIENMTNGQIGYTVPWAMYRKNAKFWLIGNYDLNNKPDKTSELQVSKHNGKYYVDTSLCRHIWEDVTEMIGNFTPIPVYEIRSGGVSQIVWE